MKYNYDGVRRQVEERGLRWDVEAIADTAFHDAGLDQAQVDRMVLLHAHFMKHYFTPQTWGWRGRIALALHFLLGRKV